MSITVSSYNFIIFYDALHNSYLDAIFKSIHIRAILPIIKNFQML